MPKTARGRRLRPFFDPGHAERRVLNTGRCLVVFISVLLLALLVRVVQLQAFTPPPLVKLAHQHLSHSHFHAQRGPLLDIRGRVLATSHMLTQLFGDPLLIRNRPAFSRIVADALNYDPQVIETQIRQTPSRRFVVLDRRLDASRQADLAMMKVRGLGTQRYVARYYPHHTHAGQVLGVVGKDGRGREGLEFAFDRELHATAGSLAFVRDVRYRPLFLTGQDYQAPVPGKPIRLTIDLTIQAIAERALAEQCVRFEAIGGQMIVMDPKNGYILAMANYPFFDPNQLARSNPADRRNRCVTDAFEPGSVYKPFIWAAATELGFAHGAQIIDCTTDGVYTSPEGRVLHDAHPQGSITWDQVLIKSSNIGMAIVAQRMGLQALYETVRAFGFGSKSGSQLPGESTGIVHPFKRWDHYSLTSVPMGQEIAVTPLQIMRAVCVIANDGMMPFPVIRCETAADLIYQRVLAKATARQTLQVLRRVITEGTGRKIKASPYKIFGKTGTAQVAERSKGYLPDQYVASFIGGAPLQRPRIVIGCFVHRPNKEIGHYGGIVAAPAAQRVIDQVLPYLGVNPGEEPEAQSE